jgi:predicted metalloprotease with PDZ domain
VSVAAFGGDAAHYDLHLLSGPAPRISVRAELPIDGQALAMETTRPGDISEINDGGWPALVRDLRVTDEQGHALVVAPAGVKGWQLAQPKRGRVTLEYAVDYSLLAARGWPAPRETAFADADHLVSVGRALFITTPATGASTVTVDADRGWKPVAPWPESGKHSYAAASSADLVDNLLVFTRTAPEALRAGGFRVAVVAMGDWAAVRPEIRRVLRPPVEYFVRMMGTRERANYVVVLLPGREHGGESFRSSFALNSEDAPSAVNRTVWGTLIAHEIFHYWNGWRLQPADYAASQWFQEGFTQYAADHAMVACGLITRDEFRAKLSAHLANYARLDHPLGQAVTRKGPPLYSGGVLAALSWDVLIRDATGGQHSLDDFLRALWRRTGEGRRAYTDDDLIAALNEVAPRDWQGFFRDCIHGPQRLPLAGVGPLAGLRLEEAATFVADPSASAQAKSLWDGLVRGH